MNASGVFDAAQYVFLREALDLKQDPAEHYLLSGEARGARPSQQFDPVYYGRKHGIHGDSPLIHYLVAGKRSGLRPRAVTEEYQFVLNGFRPGLPRVLLLADEDSADGRDASLHDLLLSLKQEADAVLLFARPPSAGQAIMAGAAATISPMADLSPNWMFDNDEASHFVDWIIAQASPEGVICRNAASALLVPNLTLAFLPALLLFNRDSKEVSWRLIDNTMAYADTVLFSSPELEAGFRERFPALASRRTSPRADAAGIVAAMASARDRTEQIRSSHEALASHPDLIKAIASEFSQRADTGLLLRHALLIRGRDTGLGPIISAPRMLLDRDGLGRLARRAPVAETDAKVKAALAPFAAQLSGNRVIRPGRPGDSPPVQPADLRVALHGHYYYPELLDELLDLLAINRTRADLFLSTDSAVKQRELQSRLTARGLTAEVRVFANRGRDVAPFFTGFRDLFAAGRYDLVGHVHSKKSPHLGSRGNAWRLGLLQSIIGRKQPMLDWIAAECAASPRLGLVFPAIATSCSWDENLALARSFAQRMRLNADLTKPFFEYPAGMMFWCRPEALKPLIDLDLQWTDYPAEPLAEDGTTAHVIERLLPFICESEGYDCASAVGFPAA